MTKLSRSEETVLTSQVKTDVDAKEWDFAEEAATSSTKETAVSGNEDPAQTTKESNATVQLDSKVILALAVQVLNADEGNNFALGGEVAGAKTAAQDKARDELVVELRRLLQPRSNAAPEESAISIKINGTALITSLRLHLHDTMNKGQEIYATLAILLKQLCATTKVYAIIYSEATASKAKITYEKSFACLQRLWEEAKARELAMRQERAAAAAAYAADTTAGPASQPCGSATARGVKMTFKRILKGLFWVYIGYCVILVTIGSIGVYLTPADERLTFTRQGRKALSELDDSRREIASLKDQYQDCYDGYKGLLHMFEQCRSENKKSSQGLGWW